MSVKSAATPWDSPSNGSALPGRERERAERARLLRAARDGDSAALVLSGAAGMGKSVRSMTRPSGRAA